MTTFSDMATMTESATSSPLSTNTSSQIGGNGFTNSNPGGLSFSWTTVIVLLIAISIVTALYHVLRRVNQRHAERMQAQSQQQGVRLRHRLLGNMFDPNPRSLPVPPPTYSDMEICVPRESDGSEFPPDYEAVLQSRLHVEILGTFQQHSALGSFTDNELENTANTIESVETADPPALTSETVPHDSEPTPIMVESQPHQPI
ncbi:hypothetical protein BATDEDRAFT_22080 [Batrachochytrium dendrobatidis JAM81]|uniref:Uncharacterized protein n=1 Tax=Batrachochytrium dendrobatidis (strain JAM81 / FGSC 10211) TaxID=684364 RepID=F4NSC1_BATDJ|nr:uncharacterized protein BATDEDRAFT_22080 [Batrachochytrium dendrobatidis JAM81]EGF83406.1 hypothetical protein BATDEDRAFT_22080 [Batrachochytrium dendrobatidis JAM81]|eukprot:XP_006675463.1 hypothetical protein BATDEDRAFT_22080 [Batrachochytrium dendrobatidis JAM81]